MTEIRYRTPTFFMHLLHRLTYIATYTIVEAPEEKRWHANPHVFATKSNKPYIVVDLNGTMCSISRVRRGHQGPWRYLMRWPFPSSSQEAFAHHFPDRICKKMTEISPP